MSGSASQQPPTAVPPGAPAPPGTLPLDRGPPPPAHGTVLLVEFEAAQLGAT